MNAYPKKVTFYAHSGTAPLKGILLAILVGGLIAAPLALVYAYFDAIDPFIYLNLIAATFVGFVAGIASGKLLRLGRIRNNLVATLVGAAVGFIALYIAWCAWPGAVFDKRPDFAFVHLLTSPGALWTTILDINRNGAWKLSSSTPKGIILWLAWSGEAAIILGTSVYGARGYVVSEPFCESCQNWCALEPRVLETHGWNGDELKRHLETKDFSYLATLGPRTPNDVEWFQIDLRRCRGCGKTATLIAKKTEIVIDENGRSSQKVETVIEGLLVNREEIELLKNFRFNASAR